jgi:hypothetical protein
MIMNCRVHNVLVVAYLKTVSVCLYAGTGSKTTKTIWISDIQMRLYIRNINIEPGRYRTRYPIIHLSCELSLLEF